MALSHRAGRLSRAGVRRRSGRLLLALGVLAAVAAVSCTPNPTCPTATALVLAGSTSGPEEASGPSRATSAGVRKVHAIAAGDVGVQRPSGMTWSTDARALIVADGSPIRSEAVVVDPTGSAVGTVDLPASAVDGTLAHDRSRGRVTVIDGVALADVDPGPAAGGGRRDLRFAGLDQVRSAAFGPTGTLYALVDDGRRVLGVDAETGTSAALALTGGRPARFLALTVHPSTGQLYLAGDDQRLYTFDRSGRGQRILDMAGIGLRDLRAMAFGPTADRTDEPDALSLYLADAGSGRETGAILEASFEPAASTAAAAVTSEPIATRDLSRLDPPSPDPSGITTVGASLMVSDTEVDETPIFDGANLYRLSRTGGLQTTGLTQPNSNEPTGLGFDPATARLFISDDDADEIFIFTPGGDGRYGTGDDSRSSFDTRAFGNTDAEGVAFDTSTSAVFIVDGVNKEVYRRASNGAVTQFDVGAFGAVDPEGIDYDAARGTLLVVDNSSAMVYELTPAGSLVRAIDIAAANAQQAAGVTVSPSSSGTGRSLYIVDRGDDNDVDPNENDGRLYEMSYESTASNAAPTVNAGPNQTINFGATATLDGSVVDDGRPAGATVTTSWCVVSGPGSVTFGNARAVDTTARFSASGTYVLRLQADDTDKSSADDTSVTVRPAGNSVLDAPVAASTDDAEENGSTGQIARAGSDLELVVDAGSAQTVGLRFAGLAVPRNATITNAYLQFTVDEVTTAAASLTVRGQAADNVPTFDSTQFGISGRPRTTASAAWNPPGWSSVGQAGANQRTSNLAPVVQQIVNRSGWTSGNALALIITGTGVRTAESFDSGSPPVLHVEFTT
jgi:hypothetical protein